MTLTPDASERAFMEEVRAFLARTEIPQLPAEYDERVAKLRAWQSRLHEAGLVGLAWPAEFGGRGQSPMAQILVSQELALAGAPLVLGTVGIDVVGPSIMDFGTQDQRHRFLPHILSCRDLWCQGFSEPEAGSDLASLRTLARPVDGGFVLDGHKVWTSNAMHAQWCAVLARTDPEIERHHGITYFLVDMASPGISARPLVQVTGDPEFGEVWFDEVFVPEDAVLGEVGSGWDIAMHTLAHERGWYAVNRQVILRGVFDDLIASSPASLSDAALRSAVHALVDLEVLGHHALRGVASSEATRSPFDNSLDKVLLAEAEQQLGRAVLEVLSPDVVLGSGHEDAWTWRNVYLYGRAASVYGGSEQIQKDIIARRILALPRG